MRNLLAPFIGSYILLLNASRAQNNMDYPAEVLNLPFNHIQFKATHNSYALDHSPKSQIDDYNVWEIELDFGIPRDSSEFIVGHDCPEENEFGLKSLRDWIRNIKSANSLQYHPIILKLEAKTRDSSGPFGDWCWDSVDKWVDWEKQLFEELRDVIGLQNWITPDSFRMNFGLTWPSIRRLKGKFIISLQDNTDNGHDDIKDPNSSSYFFIGGVPQLHIWSRKPGEFSPIKNPSDFGRALKDSANRLIMDDGYQEPWSNVLVHSPLPSEVNSSHAGWQWGTSLEPFQTIGHAINASWTREGNSTSQIINLFAGNYDEKVKLSTPAEFYAPNGTVTIGGKKAAYTIVLNLLDVDAGSTVNPIYVQLHGSTGSTTEYLLENSTVYFPRGPFGPITGPNAGAFWIAGSDIGVLKSITVRVGGDDDIAIDDIIVISATTGWKKVHAGAWIGNDNGNPRTFNF